MSLFSRIRDKIARSKDGNTAPKQGDAKPQAKPPAKAIAEEEKPQGIHALIRRGVPKAPVFRGPKSTNRRSKYSPRSRGGAPVDAAQYPGGGGWLWVSRLPCPRDPKTGEPLLDDWQPGIPAARLAQPVETEHGLRFYEPLADMKARQRALTAQAGMSVVDIMRHYATSYMRAAVHAQSAAMREYLYECALRCARNIAHANRVVTESEFLRESHAA